MALEIEQKELGHAVILILRGDVDLRSTDRVRSSLDRLIAEKKTRVVVNLERATGADSSGLGTLVAGLTRLKKIGGAMALCCLSEDMRNIMDITSVLSFFPVYESEDAAGAALVPGTV
jgi:anti-sigma B factor antagonist